MTESVRNPFVGALAARSYRLGRPLHHERALRRIRDLVGDLSPLDRGLDVACGTGLSALALAQVVDEVVACDVDAWMVTEAEPHERVHYLVASAEQMPLVSSSADVATVSSAIHWFHPDRFFAEAHRVLKPNGWLWIYDHYFTGDLQRNPAFRRWMREVYLSRYPTPERGRWADANKPKGFVKVGEDDYDDPIAFTHLELVSYLLTQSNIITAIAEGRESEAGARAWLTEQTKPFFHSAVGKERFMFRGALSVWRQRPALR